MTEAGPGSIPAAAFSNAGRSFPPILSASSGRNSCNGQRSSFLYHAYTSPKAACPASKPMSPGITEPSTWPQMPLMRLSPTFSAAETRISQVDVPTILVRTSSDMEAPTAPTWASMAPTPTFIVPGSPSSAASSGQMVPAQTSEV